MYGSSVDRASTSKQPRQGIDQTLTFSVLCYDAMQASTASWTQLFRTRSAKLQAGLPTT